MGLLGSFEEMFRLALLSPFPCGVNDRVTIQLAPDDSPGGQVLVGKTSGALAPSTKSEAFPPITAIELISRSEVPPFFIVTVLAAEVAPDFWDPKSSFVVEREILGGGTWPESLTESFGF
jgi:hypothetical protein